MKGEISTSVPGVECTPWMSFAFMTPQPEIYLLVLRKRHITMILAEKLLTMRCKDSKRDCAMKGMFGING